MNALLEQFTTAQLTAAIRGLILFALGGLAFTGWFTDAENQVIATSLAGLIVLGYGAYKRRKDGLIATTAHALKGEGVVITNEKTAKRIPARNVVASATAAKDIPGVEH